MRHRIYCGLAVVTNLLVTFAGTLQADSFDEVLGQKHTEQIYNFLEGKGYKTVGVLNFSLKREQNDNIPNFQAGPVSRNLPIRIQNALALFSPGQFGNEIRIVNDASRVIEKSDVKSYQNQQDRDKLFMLDYPILAFPRNDNAPLAKVDVFIVGDITISADRKNTTTTLKYFDNKSTKEPTEFHKIVVPTDLTILAESGISFALRSRDFDKLFGKELKSKLFDIEDTSLVLPAKKPTPPPGGTGGTAGGGGGVSGNRGIEMIPCSIDELVWKQWVDFSILFDEEPQTVFRNPVDKFKFMINEPKEGQKVSFKIKNLSSEKLGFVLFVNKLSILNSVDIETDNPEKFRKLILMPSGLVGDDMLIKGFFKMNDDNLDDSRVDIFNILSDAKTKELARQEIGKSNYFGHITLYVFKESNGSKDATIAAESVKSNLRKQTVGNEQYASLPKALESQLEKKGFIAGGTSSEKQGFSTDKINNPQQIVSASIRYLPLSASTLPRVEPK